MNKYKTVLVTKFYDFKVFTTDFYLGFLSIPVQIIVAYIFWKTSLNDKIVGGFTASSLVMYFIFIQLLQLAFMPILYLAYELWNEINSGNIIVWLLKPISYPLYILTQKLGETLFNLFPSIIIIGCSLFILSPHNIAFRITVGVISSVLGIILLFGLHFIIGILTFWVGNVLSLRDNLINLSYLLGGEILPISMFPNFMQKIANFTPLPYIYYYPSKLFSGVYSYSPEILNIFKVQIYWIIGIYIIMFILWKRGTSRYTPQGG